MILEIVDIVAVLGVGVYSYKKIKAKVVPVVTAAQTEATKVETAVKADVQDVETTATKVVTKVENGFN